MTSNEFRCAACLGVFNKANSNEDAEREAASVFGVVNASTNPDMAIVCDECWNQMKWMWEGEEIIPS